MAVEYKKALNPEYGCAKCGHHIPLQINDSYKCPFCGFVKKPKKPKRPAGNCLCWVSADICPVHKGGR